jgi:RNA polymerase sigma-70 factor (ECF subfamily)
VEAIGALYDRHHPHIFRYLWSRVRDQHQAEDLTGEVFLRMLTHLPSYRWRGVPFRSWLYRIAHNLAMDTFRKQGKTDTIPLDQAASVTGNGVAPEVEVERHLTIERVKRALQEIDPLQGEVVVLRFLSGLSLREVALVLDKSVAAVKSLQHRGLVALRAELQGEQR